MATFKDSRNLYQTGGQAECDGWIAKLNPNPPHEIDIIMKAMDESICHQNNLLDILDNRLLRVSETSVPDNFKELADDKQLPEIPETLKMFKARIINNNHKIEDMIARLGV